MHGTAIRAARQKASLTQVALAEMVGVEQGTVARWENNNIAVTTQRLRAIAEATGVSVAELMAIDPPAAASKARPVTGLADPGREFAARPFTSLPLDLPVLGTALAADMVIDGNGTCHSVEQLEIGLGDVIDHVRRPLPFIGHSGAYALYISGSSMEPRYDAGELVYIDPRRPPASGDDVVVQLHGGQDQAEGIVTAMIKRLVRRSSTVVELEQYNPACRFKLPVANISAIHRVVRLGELMGR